MAKSNFFIKEGYVENIEDGKPILNYTKAPKGDQYQFSVFESIRKFLKKNKDYKSVIDIGCGAAFKINHFLKDLPISITGVDQGFSVEAGRKTYPYINWVEDDFSNPQEKSFGKFDLIISSDVIEHLANPDFLLDRIKDSAHEKSIIFISTPERDLVRGKDSIGPPENPLHVREWNKEELGHYIESKGFKIIEHKVLDAKKLSIEEKIQSFLGKLNNKTCQLIICKLDA